MRLYLNCLQWISIYILFIVKKKVFQEHLSGLYLLVKKKKNLNSL